MPGSPLESLTLVPVAQLVLHEAVEPTRAEAVRTGVERSAVLTDPVVAAPGPDGRWLVLDGAHRTAALAALGVPVAVVQQMGLFGWTDIPGRHAVAVTDGPAYPRARLDAWAHDVRGISLDALLPDPASHDGEPAPDQQSARPSEVAPIATISAGGRELWVTSPGGIQDRLAAMWSLTRRYAGYDYVRSHADDPQAPGTSVRVSWAPIQPDDLLSVAITDQAFPPGVTRFVVRGRLLGIRVPLADLHRAAPGGTIDPAVAGRLLRRLRRLPVRHYREPVWVVETSQPDFDIGDPSPVADESAVDGNRGD